MGEFLEPSTLHHLYFRIQISQLDASVRGGELPVDLGLPVVPTTLPGCDRAASGKLDLGLLDSSFLVDGQGVDRPDESKPVSRCHGRPGDEAEGRPPDARE